MLEKMYIANEHIHNLKLIICYISSGGVTNIAKVSSGFHQADWPTTLGIVYPISFLFWFFVYLRADENVS